MPQYPSTRIDRFGVVQPNITQLATKGRILIDYLVRQPKTCKELLRELPIWNSGSVMTIWIIGYLSKANNLLKKYRLIQIRLSKATEPHKRCSSDTAKKDQSLLDLINKILQSCCRNYTRRICATNHYLVFSVACNTTGTTVGIKFDRTSKLKRHGKVNAIFKMIRLKLFPRDLN